jgi:hypothetical protein
MPFTLSHPAAVIPLRRPLGRCAVLSALVIGSMAPDFAYFVGAQSLRADTHTLASIAWFSVPVGWIAYLGFQFVLKRPAVFLLPRSFRARLDAAPKLEAFWPVTGCLAIGALTHIGWDSFTHDSGALVQRLPSLRQLWVELWGYPMGSYQILQHGSTLLGIGGIAGSIAAWIGRTPAREIGLSSSFERRLRFWGRAVAATIPLAVGLSAGLALAFPSCSVLSVGWFLAHVSVTALSTFLVTLVILAGVLRATRHPHGVRGAR